MQYVVFNVKPCECGEMHPLIVNEQYNNKPPSPNYLDGPYLSLIYGQEVNFHYSLQKVILKTNVKQCIPCVWTRDSRWDKK